MTDEKLFEITEKLLEQVKNIQEKHEEKLRKNASKFNVFEITRINHLETRMSFFLSELLDKNGTHCMGTVYLKQFFRDVLTLDTDDDELENAEICWQKKEYTKDKRKKHIDIVILTPYRYIPIEIKVNAPEGENQCYDYLGIAENQNEELGNKREWDLFYLTTDGVEPESTKNLEESRKKHVHPISWKEHITSWLEKLIKLTPANQSNVLEVIKQYKQAVEHLTGQNKEDFQMNLEDIINNSKTMKASEIMKAAIAIRKATPDGDTIRKNLMNKIFQEVGEQLDKQLGKKHLKFENEKSHSLAYIVGAEKNTTEYSLAICFEINFGQQQGCYVGFTVLEEIEQEYKYVQNLSDIDTIKDIIPDAKLESMSESEEWWLGLLYAPDFGKKHTENTPDFKNFNQAFYDLFDDVKREDFIRKVVAELSELAS